MDYIGQLAQRLAARNSNGAGRIGTGQVQGNSVLIDGRWYNATWGGDFDVLDGMNATCVIDGNKCVVVRVRQ